jgi:kynureninase
MRPAAMNPHRADFLLPPNGVYALSHSVGCLTRTARAALEAEFFRPWETHGGEAWTQWLHAIDRFRAALAKLLGGQAAHFSPQVNLSSAVSKLLSAFPRRPGRDTLVTHEESFPSIGFALDRAGGFERRLIAGDPCDFTIWRDALNDRVAAAVITHVHSNSGAIEPVRAITQRCRELGISSIVDVAQSAGIVPISLEDFDADIVVGSCVKWLCGGPGAGFMWIRPELLPDLTPTDVGWFSHRDPFEFDIRHFEYAPDARRFWGGTPSIAPYVVAAQGIETLQRIGVAAIHAHNRRLARIFLEQIAEPYTKQLRLELIGGTLCLPLGLGAGAVARALQAGGHFFDVRGTSLRLSFHIYNDQDEARDLGQLCAAALVGAPHA